MTDVTHELTRQVVDRGEDPAGDHLAFDAAEPEFDLIEPRGIGRSKMQVQLGMIGQELCDPLGLMGREVVGDDVDLATPGLQRNDLTQEGHKLLSGMAGSGLTENLCLSISCGHPSYGIPPFKYALTATAVDIGRGEV